MKEPESKHGNRKSLSWVIVTLTCGTVGLPMLFVKVPALKPASGMRSIRAPRRGP